ncbi:MAG: hypothetical protein ACOY71_12510 [Gemmatimonadota bacterium]
MQWLRWTALMGTVAVAACGGKSNDKAPPSAGGEMMAKRTDSAGGMGMQMPGMAMMPMMRAHLDSMTGMSPEQMRAMMARHDTVMSRMLDQMGSDMRSMSMTGDARWTALTDSVKRDLAELPSLQGKALTDRMRAHADRVRRLIAIHEGMMAR